MAGPFPPCWISRMQPSFGERCQQHLAVQRRTMAARVVSRVPAQPCKWPCWARGWAEPSPAARPGLCLWGSAAKRSPWQGVSELCASRAPFLKLSCLLEGKSCCTLALRQKWALASLMPCPRGSLALPQPTLAGRLTGGSCPAKAYQYLSHKISRGRGFLLSHAHRSCPISTKLPRGGLVKMWGKRREIMKSE